MENTVKKRIALYYGSDTAQAKKEAQALREKGNTVLLLHAVAYNNDVEEVDEVSFTKDCPKDLEARIIGVYERLPPSAPIPEDGSIPPNFSEMNWQDLINLANRLRDPDTEEVRSQDDALALVQLKFEEQEKASQNPGKKTKKK